jgi:hypothetical protein
MSSSEVNAEPASRGGLGVALLVFFVLAFAMTLGAQTVVSRLRGQAELAPHTIKSAKSENLVQPSPELEPNEVVSLQLKGLASEPEARGIEQCFVLASPGNKESTGPVERFAAMLHRAPYDVLLFHHLVLVGKPTIEGDTANVVVTLLDAQDRIYIFQFVLSKQHGEGYENCWMTDAVFPIQQIPDSTPSESPTAQLQHALPESLTSISAFPSLAGPQVQGGFHG